MNQYKLTLSNDIVIKMIKFLSHKENGKYLNSHLFIVDSKVVLCNKYSLIKLKGLEWEDLNGNTVDFTGNSSGLNLLTLKTVYEIDKKQNIIIRYENGIYFIVGENSGYTQNYTFNDHVSLKKRTFFMENVLHNTYTVNSPYLYHGQFLYDKKQIKKVVKKLNDLYIEQEKNQYKKDLDAYYRCESGMLNDLNLSMNLGGITKPIKPKGLTKDVLYLSRDRLCREKGKFYPQTIIDYDTLLVLPINTVICIDELARLDIFVENDDSIQLLLSNDKKYLMYDTEQFTCYIHNYYETVVSCGYEF